MITIYYSREMVEGEPGPNFYWRGSPIDFLQIVVDLHILGRKNGTQLELSKLKYVKAEDGYCVMAKSSANGNILCKVNRKDIIIDLDSSLWRKVLYIFLGISFFPCHEYVEFDGLQLKEDANFIVSSEVL